VLRDVAEYGGYLMFYYDYIERIVEVDNLKVKKSKDNIKNNFPYKFLV